MKKDIRNATLGALAWLGMAAVGSAAEIAPATMEFLSSTTISGHVQASYNYNFHGSNTGGLNPLRVFDTSANNFMLNQFLLRLDNPADKKDDWDAGYKVVLIGGQDAGVIKSAGLGTATNIDVNEAFVRANVPIGTGLGVQAGKFVTLMGTEVIDAEGNFQFSRSYLFGFAIPFAHTGLMLDYSWNDNINTKFIVTNGWDQAADLNTSKTYMGSIALILPEAAAKMRALHYLKGSSLIVTGVYGPEQAGATAAGNNNNERWVIDVVAAWPITEKLQFMANYDVGQESFAGAPHGEWWGVAGYLKYLINDTWHIGLRGEFFSDNELGATGNTRTAFALDSMDGIVDGLIFGGGPSAGGVDLQAYTLTVMCHKWKNLWVRGEARYDHASVPIFDGGTKQGQATISLDMMYIF